MASADDTLERAEKKKERKKNKMLRNEKRSEDRLRKLPKAKMKETKRMTDCTDINYHSRDRMSGCSTNRKIQGRESTHQ
jgi:hypothetical protein